MSFNKVVDFYGDIEGGTQFISIHLTCESLATLIDECDAIKHYLEHHHIKGKLGKNWDYKIGFYEARDGIVTVGSI